MKSMARLLFAVFTLILLEPKWAVAESGWLGIRILTGPPKLVNTLDGLPNLGAFVSGVVPGGSAKQAGIRAGDVIFELAGRKIQTGKSLVDFIKTTRPGQTIQIRYYRGRQPQTINLRLKRFPNKEDLPSDSDAESRYQEVLKIDKEGRYDLAFSKTVPLAEEGHRAAQNLLGLYYEMGRGTAANIHAARAWYRIAAEQGFGSAYYNLGSMYQHGAGVFQNYVSAYFLLIRGAASGHARSIEARDKLAKLMTPQQVAKAQSLNTEAEAPLSPLAEPAPPPVSSQAPSQARSQAPAQITPQAPPQIPPPAPPPALSPAPSPALPQVASKPAPAAGVPMASVEETQRLLTQLGYRPGPADGQMGRKTRAAIQAFQRAQGLTVDGQVSKSLTAALEKAVASPAIPQVPPEDDDLGDLGLPDDEDLKLKE